MCGTSSEEIEQLRTQLAQAHADAAEMREALEYYAHQENYERREMLGGFGPPAVLIERGSRARAALEKWHKAIGGGK